MRRLGGLRRIVVCHLGWSDQFLHRFASFCGQLSVQRQILRWSKLILRRVDSLLGRRPEAEQRDQYLRFDNPITRRMHLYRQVFQQKWRDLRRVGIMWSGCRSRHKLKHLRGKSAIFWSLHNAQRQIFQRRDGDMWGVDCLWWPYYSGTRQDDEYLRGKGPFKSSMQRKR